MDWQQGGMRCSSNHQYLENAGHREVVRKGCEQHRSHDGFEEHHEWYVHCSQPVRQFQSWFYQAQHAKRPRTYAFPSLYEVSLSIEKERVVINTYAIWSELTKSVKACWQFHMQSTVIVPFWPSQPQTRRKSTFFAVVAKQLFGYSSNLSRVAD